MEEINETDGEAETEDGRNTKDKKQRLNMTLGW